MQTTPKANNILGHFFALLGAVVMLAIATWVSASSSQQVQPLDNLAVPRTGHAATALSDGGS
jgi:ABC-type lipoprotein release transport system permease subunit